MNTIIKIILANAPIENGNRGCQALSITALYLIKKLFKNQGKECVFYLPDSQCVQTGKHTYKILDENVDFYACGYPYGTTFRGKIKSLLKFNEFKDNLNIFNKADFILDIGQGDSFADIYGINRFKMIDRIHRLSMKFGKKYCLLPQTVGPFKDPKVKKIAEESITNSSFVMVRDKQSYDYVVKNVPAQKQLKEYIDIAFFMPYKKFDFKDDFIHVGLNVSALLWNGGYTGDNQFGLKCDYRKLIRTILDFFLKIENVKLHLVPHVVGENRGIENDYEVSYDLWSEYNHKRLILAPFFLGPIEAKNYISSMDFFMGARMHSTIGAFSSCVAVHPMAYSRKFNGLFKGTLGYPYMSDMKEETNEKIFDDIKESFIKRKKIQDLVEKRMGSIVVKRKELLLDDLKSFFEL